MNQYIDRLPAIHAEAVAAAKAATQKYLDQHGDFDTCGFSWVKVHGVKMSTRFGKAMGALGFSKAYGGGIELWNPSGIPTQSISAKEAGSSAYKAVFLKYFPDMKIYAGSRVD